MTMEEQYNSLLKFKDELENASTFDQVIKTSRDLFFMKITIDFNFNKFIQSCKAMREICDILTKHLMGIKSQSLQKVIIKTIMKLSTRCMENRHEKMLSNFSAEYGELAATIMNIYGLLQNSDSVRFNDPKLLYECFVQSSLKYSENTKFFAIAIENYTLAYDLRMVKRNEPFTLTVILTNLENAHQYVSKSLLELLRRVILLADDSEIVNVAWKMSWYNRNKYYILSHLIVVRPDILLNSELFDVKNFVNGLRIGLSQYHLYSSSLALIKVIYAKDEFKKELIVLSADILTDGSDYEVDNFLKLWFSAYDDKFKDELFKIIINSRDFSNVFSTLQYFHRAIVIRNAFGRSLSEQMDFSIKEFCCSIGNNVRLKIDVYNFLIGEVYKPAVDMIETFESVLRLLKFLQCNMCVEDSLFIDFVMRKMPNFFNHLATNRFRNPDVCMEIFTIIRRDLYEHGVDFGVYETTIFSLRLLEVILKQYCGTMKGKSLSKNTDKSINLKFKQYLKNNEIWDITSSEIFHQLVKMANDTENSDISTTANEILVEYFIKTRNIDDIQLEHVENFENWINIKVHGIFNSADVESYHENISYWRMKYEFLSASACVMELIADLRLRSAELKASRDPVGAMQRGRSLYALIDCINYSISRMDDVQSIVPVMTSLMIAITKQILDFVNDGVSCPSFDVIDGNLTQLVQGSSWKSENVPDMKHRLLLFIFFTLRALSELSRTISKAINEAIHPEDNLYFTTLSACIDVNIQILSRFCHKGVIEAACSALGSITNLISTKFYQQCNRTSQGARNLQTMLITLKQEIDCGKRHKSSKTGEIRGSRGFLVMSHSIIRNHKPFLKFLMQKLLITKDIVSFYDTRDIRFANDIQPIHLHLLAALVKDSELVEEMLKYYDFILLATFKAYKESKEFIVQNALLQIIGNMTPKIANHKRHAIDETELPHYEAKAISVYEFYVKLTYVYRIAVVDLEMNLNELSQMYIIILLEIFSNFEYREPYEYWSEMDRPVACFKALMNHRCEKIRTLAAKCFAQWHLSDKLPKIINKRIENIFSTDPNWAHGNIIAIRHMMQRYEASVKYIDDKFNKEAFLKKIRRKVSECSKLNSTVVESNFFLRCYQIDFLHFLGFKFDDEVIVMLMDETKVGSKIGFSLWKEKVKMYQAIKN